MTVTDEIHIFYDIALLIIFISLIDLANHNWVYNNNTLLAV